MVVSEGDDIDSSPATAAAAAAATAAVGSPNGAAILDPYKSSRFVGHSLWMIPSRTVVGGSLQAYDAIIGEMAQELGTFHFVPHITLVAALLGPVEDIVQKTRHLGTLVAPYEFQWDDSDNSDNNNRPPLSYKDAYFQCVFARMKLTDAVVQANATARQVFQEKQMDPPYMPHLSLIYGDYSETEKKERLIPQLCQKFHDRKGGGTADADAANGTCYATIPVDAIEIWSTQGDVKDWYLVERVPLVGTTKIPK
jgi:Cyclic phosphodiesterase-like protein